MTFSRTRGFNFLLMTFAFLVILISILLVELICHAKLPTDIAIPTLGSSQLLIIVTTAVLVTLLTLSLFLRTRQLSAELREKDLLRIKEDWEKTFNSMTDFVSVHDKDFKVTKVNPALCQFLGKNPNEILGKPCYQVFHSLNEPYAKCPHVKTSATEHSVSEIITDPKLGVPLQITCSPIFNDANEFQGSLHVARVSEEIDNRKNKPAELIPICASCKSIRNIDNEWLFPDEYFLKKYNFQFTHTVCKNCSEKLYPDFIRL